MAVFKFLVGYLRGIRPKGKKEIDLMYSRIASHGENIVSEILFSHRDHYNTETFFQTRKWKQNNVSTRKIFFVAFFTGE